MSRVSSIHSPSVKGSVATTSISSQRSSAISRIAAHLQHVKKRWGPLMAAKQHWEDEYNFPAGPYAGQKR
ncbi:hypothetical protein BDV59DRAFT_189654 [Aspergillus ambiguus]|uniref:uncharacterized protein n=1 Tax=Aspergillus ambiguus TaxID=176160 RepID=UPI003CCCAD15